MAEKDKENRGLVGGDDRADADEMAQDGLRALLDFAERNRHKSHSEKEFFEKGFTRKGGSTLLQTVAKEGQAARGAAVAASLTDESFADPLSKRVWSLLPERIQNTLLVDFQCTACLLRETLAMESEAVEQMTRREHDAAMEKAMAVLRELEAQGGEAAPHITQLEDICIAFAPSSAPGALDGKDALQVTGNCARCGYPITRTYISEDAQLLGAFGRLLRLAEEAPPGKIGRNSQCPCGSGLKYKKCCGKVQ